MMPTFNYLGLQLFCCGLFHVLLLGYRFDVLGYRFDVLGYRFNVLRYRFGALGYRFRFDVVMARVML